MILGISLLAYGGDCPPAPFRLVAGVMGAASKRGHSLRVYGPAELLAQLPAVLGAELQEISDPTRPSELFTRVCKDPPDAMFFPQFWITPPQLSTRNVVLLPDPPADHAPPSGPYRTSGFADILRRADRALARSPEQASAWRALLPEASGVSTLRQWPADDSGSWESASQHVVDALEGAAAASIDCQDPLPLVSIVTPSYQQGRFIERTIESVLGQDYPHIELLILDGGSRDETLGVLEKYNSRVRWISRKDRGQSDAINRGLRAARGEILAYLNSDDTYTPGAIRRAVAFLVGQPQCDLVYGRAWNIDENDGVIEPYPTERFDPDRLLEQCILCQPSAFWRRRLHDKIGYFDEDVHYVMDYEFWLRAARHARVGMLEAYQARNRIWAGAKSTDARSKQILQALEVVHRHHGSVQDYWLNAYLDMSVTYPVPEFLPGPVKVMVRAAMRKYYTMRLLSKHQGGLSALRRVLRPAPAVRYADLWLGKKFKITLPVKSSSRALRLTGDSPAWPRLGSPLLAIRAAGRPVATLRLPWRGAFNVDLPLPKLDPDSAAVEVEIISDSTFIPATTQSGGDYRALSVRLHGIELVD